MGEFEVTLLIFCIHLLGLGIEASETCTPTECLICDRNISDSSDPCQCNQSCHNNVSAHCRQDFNVTLTTSPTKVKKLEDVTVICVSNLPRANLSIRWIVNQNLQEEDHNETFQILKIAEQKEITCNISSICGIFFNTTTITAEDTSGDGMIILICVLAAFLLLVTFAIVMRIIQSKGQAQREARKRQREQNIQNIHSAATVTNYW